MTGVAGRVAVVTGAANGIGRGIAEALLKGGASLAAIDIVEADWSALAPLAAPGRHVAGYRCDVADAGAVTRTCSEVLATFGGVDILVNDAGGAGAVAVQHVEDLTDAVWRHVIDLNLTSVVNLCRELVPAMKVKRYGRIVSLSSQARFGTIGPLNTVNARLPYVAAKGAIVALTKQLAKDLAPFGITCNAVAPGLILPGPEARISRKFNELPPEARERILAGVPAGRPGTAADVAAAVAFLASEEAAFVSGETLGITGGQ
jgi:NAD(P)-dependent dehydrogenase (short-subunit alcohol dehydrogenase family)